MSLRYFFRPSLRYRTLSRIVINTAYLGSQYVHNMYSVMLECANDKNIVWASLAQLVMHYSATVKNMLCNIVTPLPPTITALYESKIMIQKSCTHVTNLSGVCNSLNHTAANLQAQCGHHEPIKKMCPCAVTPLPRGHAPLERA